jgi:IclR family KDG regulon transcriptional repressor
MTDPSEKAKMLHRAVLILECFTQERPILGVREVSRLVCVPTSAAGRLMTAMKELGILSQNPTTKTYSIGPRVLTWAGTYLSTSDIRNLAYPFLESLHDSTHETISLYILDGNERVCIERLESTQNVRFVAPRVGRHLPLHAGSAGKVMLAFLPEWRQEEILDYSTLERLTEKTIIDPTEMRSELARIRQQGYAISNGEWILDASGIAAPIFDRGGEVAAALTISGPTQRFTDENVPEYIMQVVRVAAAISNGLGYRVNIVRQIGIIA